MRYTLDSMLPLDAFQPRGGVFAKGMPLHGGGGGIPIVSDVVDFVGDAASGVGDVLSGVADTVGGAIEDVGGFVQDVGQGAIDVVNDVGVVLDEAVADVIPGGWGTVGTAVATYFGGPLGAAAAQGIEGAATGQDWEDTLKDMAMSAGTAAISQGMDFGFDPNAADALASGEIAGFTTGAVDDMLSQGVMDMSTIANLSDDAIGTMNALGNWTGTLTDNIGTAAVELANQGVAEGELAKYLSSQYGIDAYAAANAAGIASAGGDASSIADVIAADYGADMTGLPDAGTTGSGITGAEALAAAKKAMQVAQVAKQGYGLVNALTGGTGNTQTASPLLRTTSLGSTLGSGSTSSGSGALPGNLEGTFLAAAPVTQGSNMNLNQLKQLYPQLSTIDPKLLQTLMGKAAATSAMGESGMGGGTTGLSMAGQGGTPSAGYPAIAADRSSGATKFTGESPLSGKFSALSAAGLDALGGAKNAYGLKDGGQPHIPQFKTGTTGHYVQGEGDGQSDDIPAMLADGEYVFDADTVAALGNGSNKAGALQLDRMRQEIRKHKRSAPHNKIPPKAKSPLEYLKGK